MQVSNFCFKNNISYSRGNNMRVSSNKVDHSDKLTFGSSPNVVFLLDSLQHSKDLQHFAKAINHDMKINPIEVEVNSNNPLMKQIQSLRNHLSQINSFAEKEKPDYVAIPASCNVPLLNLSDQINSVCNSNVYLTPKNVLENKEGILDFLKTIFQNPTAHHTNIAYMDGLGQGVENAFGLIKEINKAVQNGIKVYIPAGHPQENSIKWMAKEQNLKPELRHYISTGVDPNNSINNLKNNITDRNWYNFNLLNLSDAKNVNLGDVNGNKHLYSAFDSCIKESERGVYNFTPIRENEKIAGFSFLDEKTINYPIEEYAKSGNISNISKFVGLPIEKVLAPPTTNEKFMKYLRGNSACGSDDFINKIFDVNKVFTPEEISKNKIRLKGDYVDSSLTLYFRANKDGNVIFPNCDYEQSSRPSVVSMWGSCFSLINAINRNIRL